MNRLLRKALILFALAVAVAYLVYRFTTLNLSSPYAVAVSWMLYLAECYTVVSLALYYLDVWDPREPTPEEPLGGRTVDVLVPTYNEDVQLLRNTLTACLRMEYPHRTYVLDDGNRPEVRALADELGVEYITREHRIHAKAGNLNHALQRTRGEFVIVFDADHVPEPHFIKRLIGYFHDPQLAFVQTPHAFYNMQSFQSIMDPAAKQYWDEQYLFYNVIQPGKNAWNAATFCGSAAMFRREAIEQVGGIATETITEDFHTGLRMHARGWKSLYVGERLIVGQAAPDVTTFHSQRLRWGEGNLSVLAYDNPLTMRGLTLSQRLSYLGSILNWCAGIPKLAIYLTPLLVLATGIAPVIDFTWTLFYAIVGYLVTLILVTKLVSNGYGDVMATETYSMATFWNQCRAVFRSLFGRRRQKFVVTSKRGRQAKSVWPFVLPQTILVFASFVVLLWGWLRQGLGLTDDWLSPLIASGWAVLHAGLALVVIQRAMEVENQRFAYRHTAFLPVRYRFRRWDRSPLEGVGITADLNEHGLSLISYQALPVGQVGELAISGPGENVVCTGEIRVLLKQAGHHEGTPQSPAYFRYGVQLIDLTTDQVDALARLGLQYCVPKAFAYFGNRRSLWDRMTTFFRRRWTRRAFHLPVVVAENETDSEPTMTATEDISPAAFRVTTKAEMGVGKQTEFLMATPFGAVQGVGRVIREDKTVVGGRELWSQVMEFQKLHGRGSEVLQTLLYSSARRRAMQGGLEPLPSQPRVYMGRPAMVGLALFAVLVPLTAWLFNRQHQDEIFLERAASSGRLLNDEGLATVDRIYRNAMAEFNPPIVKMRQLRDVFIRHKNGEVIKELTAKFAKRLPENLDLQRAWADVLSEGGRHEEAEERYAYIRGKFESSGVSEESRTAVLLATARNFVHSRQFDKALPYFQDVLKRAPQDPTLKREYLGLLMAMKRYDDALQLYASISPTLDDRRVLMAIYESRQDFASAERECRAVLLESPKDPLAKKALPELLRYQKRYKEAIPLFLEQIAAGQTDAATRYKVIEMQSAAQDFEGAEVQVRAILAADPRDQKSAKLLPEILYFQKNYEAAIPQYRSLLPGGADELKIRWRLANLYAATEKYDEAERECRSLLQKSPKHAEARKLLPDLLAAQRKFAAAAALCTQMWNEGDRDPLLKLRIAQLNLWQGENAAALSQFRELLSGTDFSTHSRAAEIERELWKGYLDAAAPQEKLEDVDRRLAGRLYDRLKANPGQDAVMVARLAAMFRTLKDLPRSISLLESATRLKPNDRTIRLQYADTLQEKGDLEAADQVYKSILADNGTKTAPPLPALSSPAKPAGERN